MSHIVILESLGISREELSALKAPFEKKGHVFSEYPRTADTDLMLRQTADADALIIANMPLPGNVIRGCGKLRFIDVAFTGVDHVDLSAARERHIAVSNASGYSTEAVAEWTLGAALSLLRNLAAVEARCRAGLTKDGLVGSELRGKTVGVIGYGKIGRRSAELFHAFGCPVLAYSRTRRDNVPAYVTQTSLDELLARSDLVVLHCPLNSSTQHMIDAKRLSAMKRTAILINAARGPVVVTQDLADALNAGVIAGACVDVFDREPPLDPAEPLLSCKNCLVTPHVAFASAESMRLRAQMVFDNLSAWMDGHPQNVVL